MAWIEASAAGGGSTGGGNTIMVTCSESFAGLPITCTNGLTTKTLNCPSTAPYVIQFTDIVADEWTISGTIDGTTYSTTVEVGDIFTTTLESGFDWKSWVDLSQNYHSSDFDNLAEVLADEEATRELMTIHASADYLIDAVSDDIDVIDDFCANDTAMKWIGLRDYVCDGLTAINGVEAKFLASQYWERYLKDHVPTMTGNTAPYGELTSSPLYDNNYPAWKAFDGYSTTSFIPSEGTDTKYIQHKGTNPMCVKRWSWASADSLANIKGRVNSYTLLGSNDGTNWETLDAVNTEDLTESSFDRTFSNDNYYLYHRVNESKKNNNGIGWNTLQFYGRSLNVSVPIMTSNTTPFGECNGNFDDTAYKAFDGATTTQGTATILTQPKYLGYTFPSKVCVKAVEISEINNRTNYRPWHMQLKGSDDNYSTETLIDSLVGSNNVVSELLMVNNSDSYKGFRLYVQDAYNGTSTSVASSGYCNLDCLQFYGVDYSEREFEPNTNKKWLYDHGLNLENLEAYVVNPASGDYVTFESDYIDIHYTGVSGGGRRTVAKTSMDLTNYNLAKVVIDDFGASSLILGVFASDSSTSSIAQVDLTKPFNYLDISSVDSNASVQVGRYISGNTGYGKVTELWLE